MRSKRTLAEARKGRFRGKGLHGEPSVWRRQSRQICRRAGPETPGVHADRESGHEGADRLACCSSFALRSPPRTRESHHVQMARNTDVSPYIGKLSRSQVYSKKGQYKRERKGVASTEPTAAEKRASYYPADDSVSRPKLSRKANKQTKLRATITPGTVVILLAGRFRGQSTPFFFGSGDPGGGLQQETGVASRDCRPRSARTAAVEQN